MRGLIFVFLLIFNVSILAAQQSASWQGNLAVIDNWAPFDLIQNTDGDSTSWEIRNGKEKFVLDQITRTGDSIFVSIPAYDTQIRAKDFGDSISGKFVKNYIENDNGIDFKAYKGRSRFPATENRNELKLEGRWEIKFEGSDEINVAVFSIHKGEISGSVLSNSGDLRFLYGSQTADGFTVSTFTGLSSYLLTIKVKNDSTWEGYMHTSRSKTRFTAKYNPKANLENPYHLTKLNTGQDSLSFKLKDLNGNWVSVSDQKYKNKVLIVSILGSWCPNCLDEQAYLSEWYKLNKEKGIEVIGVAFERKDDAVYANKFLTNLKNRLKIEYPLLFGGKIGMESTKRVFPEIEQIKIYPTTLFIAKDGKVSKIHTGYNGPATGLFYEEFKKEFDEIVNDLLQK